MGLELTGFSISNKTYNALSGLDKDKNGISSKELQELKKLDTDKDGKLSVDELKDLGITDEKDIENINKALSSSSGLEPSEILFPKPEEKKPELIDKKLENLTGEKKPSEPEEKKLDSLDFKSLLEGIETPKSSEFPGYVGKEKVDFKLDDRRIYDKFISVVSEVDKDIADKKIEPSKRKEAVVDKLLTKLCGAKFDSLPPKQKEELKKFLMTFDINELIGIEKQGLGGASSGAGVTGTGSGGHYTVSILSSVSQLINTDRLTPQLLTALNKMKTCELHDDLKDQRNSIIRSTMQEIAFPESINQHAKGTCAATSVQIHLAIKDPVKYINIVSGLASPGGNVSGKDFPGGELERNSGTTKADDSGRSISSRLVQPAFMDYANGSKDYDNKADTNRKFLGLINSGGGLYNDETTHLLNGIYGEGSFKVEKGEGKDILPKVEESLKKGEAVAIGMRWDKSAHEVLVTKIDKEKNLAYFMNPWGELHTMPLDELTERMNGACIPVSPKGSKALMDLLPGAAKDPSAYTSLSPLKYRTMKEHFDLDPVLKTLKPEQKAMILEQFSKFGLDTFFTNDIKNIISQGKIPIDLILKNLGEITNNTSAKDYMNLLNGLDLALQFGKITVDKAKEILSAQPEKYLKSSENAELTSALITGDKNKIDELTVKSKVAKANSLMDGYTSGKDETKLAELIKTTSTEGNPSPLVMLLEKMDLGKLADELENDTQASDIAMRIAKAYEKDGKITGNKLDKFITVLADQHREGAVNSFINQAAKDGLLPKIPSGTLKTIMTKFMDGYTSGSKEQAIVNIMKKATPEQQRAVLSDPKFADRLINELGRGDVVNIMKTAATRNDWDIVRKLFDSVKREDNGASDSFAEDFIRGLNTQKLNSVPPDILKKMYKSMDDGWTTGGENAMMEKIEKSANWKK